MRILLASNAPWAKTGYGTQGASLARRLRDAGHNVVYYANWGLEGGTQEWEGIEVLPSTGMSYVDPIIKGHLRYTQPDLLITLHDLWPWAGTDFPEFVQSLGIRWLAWFPIDALPVSPKNLAVLPYVDYPVALANFAEDALNEIGLDSVKVIPHGIENEFGYTRNGRREFRRLLQVPEDAFLYGTVGRNAYYPGRKGFDRLFRAFSELPEAVRKRSYLYCHALTNSEHGSVPLPQVAEFYGISDRVMFQDEYNGVMGYSQNGMNALYSALDCYVQPTLGEGFGIPVLEAQACGANVIATDCTSMPELLCPDASQLVPAVTEIFTPDPAHRALIDIPALTAAMLDIFNIWDTDRLGYEGMKGRAGLWANAWDWNKLWQEEWVPYLAEIEKDIELRPRGEWHRGGGRVFEHEDMIRKQDSSIRSPAVQKELALLRTLDHHNIVKPKAHGVDEDGTTWFDMTKYRPLSEIQADALTTAQQDVIISGVRDALTYLHGKGLAHRDVCVENVMLRQDFSPVLIDFEWAVSCDGEIGESCVDFEPWSVPEQAVPTVQSGMAQRGFHTIVQHVRGIDLSDKSHGYKSVPYQQIDGVGERDCERRWNLMQPDVKGKTVLDIGCNLGWFVRKSVSEGAEAEGWDNDASVLDAAKDIAVADGGKYYLSSYEYRDLNEDLPGEDFDVIFCLSVLQHLKDPDRVFQWMLDHGKELYIEIPHRFITPLMAEHLSHASLCGESERGRPIWHLKALVPA